MKRLIPIVAMIISWVGASLAAAPTTLTSLRVIHGLSNEQAKQAVPVAFEATVIYFRSYEKTMFVQDGDVAIYVQATTNAHLVPGDRILIKGTTRESFRPFVLSNDITLLHHGASPTPVPAGYSELIRAEHDCMLVSVRARILAVDLVMSSDVASTNLQMLTDEGTIDAIVDSSDPGQFHGLLDSEVEVTGAASNKFDGKMQPTGVLIHVSSWADVKVLKLSLTTPASLPETPMNQILTGYHVQNLSQRVRVHGTITYFRPGYAIVLQSGAKSLWIQTVSTTPVQIGDVADVTGFPGLRDGFLALTSGNILDTRVRMPIAPQPATWRQLVSSGNAFDLVSIEGQVVSEAREGAQDEYVLISDGQMFSAIFRHPPPARLVPDPPPAMRQIPLGSRVRLTGICILDDSNPFNVQVPFTILMRSFDDMAVVAEPPWLNIRHLVDLIGILLFVVVAVGARGWALDRKLHRHSAAIAGIGRLRARILEDINGSLPLSEIIQQITELVSFKLKDARCWYRTADGTQLGNCPPDLTALRIVRHEIFARSGSPNGEIFAAFNPLAKPGATEAEALAVAVSLCTLAIETRRLYSDLLHRSEFDLLTDLHNRFSLDKHFEVQIDQARLNDGIFGLIYIDMDGFKQINDLYGHHIGDLYLQEAALRMKNQLRSDDLLARLGGDEFATLVALVPSRAGVVDIAQRLECCFDEPFELEGYIVRGSASVGVAIYPENGVTKDSLLRAADAAMYRTKNAKRQVFERASSHNGLSLTRKKF